MPTSSGPRPPRVLSAASACPEVGGTIDGTSVQPAPPVFWYPAGGAGHGLIQWMVVRRAEGRAFEVLLPGVVPEPILAGLEALNDRVSMLRRVSTRVPRGRRIAAADVAALRTSPQVEPPAAGGKALH